MDKIKPYYSMAVNDTTAEIVIYGGITSWPWLASDVSAYLLSRKPSELDPAVTQVNVFINSYGGEVSEGLAIYNALRRHPAQVTTYCDGFACSAAVRSHPAEVREARPTRGRTSRCKDKTTLLSGVEL